MTFRVVYLLNSDGRSPFHVVETPNDREVVWVNRFLDRECARCLAQTTVTSCPHPKSPPSSLRRPTCPVSLLLFTSPSTYWKCSAALSPPARIVVCWIDLPTA